MYIRKTRDIWLLMSNYGYGHGWEEECEYDNYKEAKADLKAYRENSCGNHFLKKRRVRITSN